MKDRENLDFFAPATRFRSRPPRLIKDQLALSTRRTAGTHGLEAQPGKKQRSAWRAPWPTPEVLNLDEPASAWTARPQRNPQLQVEIGAHGKTIFLSSHIWPMTGDRTHWASRKRRESRAGDRETFADS